GELRELLSFPTRRSSDLAATPRARCVEHLPRYGRGGRNSAARNRTLENRRRTPPDVHSLDATRVTARRAHRGRPSDPRRTLALRLEEHTSELQSSCNLVC